MSFSLLQVPRCKVHALGSSWWKCFQGLSSNYGSNHSLKVLSSTYGFEGHSKRWTRRTLTTKTGENKNSQIIKPSNIAQEILEGTVSNSTNLAVNIEFQRTQYYDIRRKIAEKGDLVSLVTTIVFDIETTGLSRDNDRIIEIALQDLQGGENSTFQTLVNPGIYVPKKVTDIHGISNHMVNRHGIPRMEDLIPILLQYVRSRQKPEGFVLFVAHNARSFDVPFLMNEFSRCSAEIPRDWLYLDSLLLGRERVKAGGSDVPTSLSLKSLREHYKIPLVGSAHRAMSDVNTLSLVLQKLTFDLKLPLSGLVERSFTASDLINLKKKKKKN